MRDAYPLEDLATTFPLEDLRSEFTVAELVGAGLVEEGMDDEDSGGSFGSSWY